MVLKYKKKCIKPKMSSSFMELRNRYEASVTRMLENLHKGDVSDLNTPARSLLFIY